MSIVVTQPIVYILDPSVATTGALVAARQIARLLAGHAQVVLVLPKHAHVSADELQDFVRVEYVPMVNPSLRLNAMIRYLPALLYGAIKLRVWMRRDRSSCLLINDFYLLHGIVMRATGFSGDILNFVRCHPSHFAGAMAKPMLFAVKLAATYMIAVSQYMARCLPSTSRVVLLYDAFVGRARQPYRFAKADVKTFLFIGNYIPGKGQDMALEAFIRVAKDDNSLRLAFYGADMGLAQNRAYRARLEACAAESGVSAQITFGGYVADTSLLLASAFAALNFSQSESFSLTVLEAQGCGVPVIATRSGGPEEIILNGVTGLLIPVGDIDAAAEAMRLMASDPERVEAMGVNAAKHVAAHFTQEAYRNGLLKLLRM